MNERIQTLDGIRGMAVLLVIAGHTIANYQPLDPGSRQWLLAFANPGAGVRLFFVLSGYLITLLLLREKQHTGTISVTDFYRRRSLRIFPAFFAYLFAITILSFWMPTGVTPQTFAAAATFTWNYQAFWITPPPEDTWNLGHLWTLALEQQFYLFWPITLLLFGARRACWIAVALIIWCPLARVGSYYLFPAQRGMLGMMLHTGVDSLMAGCATAMLLQSSTWRQRIADHGARFAAVAVAWLMLLSPLMNIGVRGFSVACGFTVDAIAASCLVAWVHHAPARWVQRTLGRGVLPALGIISYSLYLWQQVFLSPTTWLANGQVVLPLLLAGVAGVLSYHFVEKPGLRIKTRPSAPAATVAVT